MNQFVANRVFLIVLDSFGIGALPDAEHFGDAGANTLKSISTSPFFRAETLRKLGLGNIPGVDCLSPVERPEGCFGRCMERSAGKDTTTGHWELAGVISETPMPTFPGGFPDEVLSALEQETGRGVLCNRPYSGTEVIRDFGEEHLRTGKLIVYTSADSVFQIAAHESVVPTETLYDYCRAARRILTGNYAVGRVIARPFTGTPGNFVRTANRRDFSLEPTGETMLDFLKKTGFDVIGVGKIGDIFAGRGLTESYPTHSNREGMEMTRRIAEKDFHGLCFVNLVDFDMLYGHRNDADGYARTLAEFDDWLGEFLPTLREGDAVILTADHGCDPGDVSTDHTREYIPLLITGKPVPAVLSLGTFPSFTAVGKAALCMLGVASTDIKA